MGDPLTVGSLCTGYGGIELGLRQAGLDFEVRWCAEVEPSLTPILHAPNLGDITSLDWNDVEPVDLIVGGIPCQPTSSAGRRLGEADPRWLWPYARTALATLKPPRFLLENVRGLVSFDKGKLWQSIIDDLMALSYDVRWLTLGACAVGLAHHRHRVFLLAGQSGPHGIMSTRLDVEECGARLGRQAQPLLPTATARDGDGRGTGDSAYWSGKRGERTQGRPLDAVIALLPTPSATSYGSNQGGASPDGPVRHSLDALARHQLLPTPNAADASGGRRPLPDTVVDSRVSRPSGQGFGLPLASAVQLLPTPRATLIGPTVDAVRGARGDLALPSAVQPQRWGRFADAVIRHADVLDLAPPEPTEPNRNGAPRLRAEFVEWLMGVPAGHVTDHLDRKASLKALGNGVVPSQIARAWLHLTDQLPTNYAQPPTTTTGDRSMATTEETRIALETINNARLIAVNRAQDATDDLGPYDAGHYRREAKALHAGMMAVAAYWREESQRLESAIKKTKGWKGRSEFLLQAAGELAGFAGDLVMPSFLGELTDESPSILSPETQAFIAGNDATAPTAWPRSVCIECLPASDNDDPRTWCDCERDERCPVGIACGKRAHFSESCPNRADATYLTGVKDYLSGASDTLPEVPIDDTEAVVTIAPALTFVDPASPPARLTWAAFAAGVNALPPREHGSHSLISSLAECGVKFALDRMGRHDIAGVTPELPAWYMVGGTAFHKATEQIERLYMTGGDPESLVLAKTWEDHFQAEIIATEAESNVSSAQWRAAKKGLEGYDWWRVQGEAMLKSYLRYWDATRRGEWEIFVMPDGRPALELELTLDVDSWPVVCIIDQVRVSTKSNALRISDLKSGATKQAETFQLGLYAHALGQTLAGESGEYLSSDPRDRHRFDISGGFYDARAGSHDLEVADLLSAHPWDEIVWRTRAARSQLDAAAYLPRVSVFGGGCSSCGQRALCPAQRS